ncbi:MAG: hypothetical protein RLZZ182_2552 [Pseudomonadota bacterium]|jgi:hypothetical protein
MAQVMIERRSRTPLVIAAVVVGAGVAIAAYLMRSPAPSEGASVAAQAPNEVPSQAPVSDGFQRQATTEERAEIDSIKAQQAQASAAMESQPAPEPVTAAPMNRPDYLSDMEWTMLQGVANQAKDPQAELTRLVNAVRFNKQLEMWQDLPADADPAKRRTLARALLDDLPERVKAGNYGISDAKGMAEKMVADIDTDDTKRAARVKKEFKRLEAADAAYRKAEGH